MENLPPEKDDLKRAWNDDKTRWMNLLYIINKNKKGKEYSFSTKAQEKEVDESFLISHEKKDETHCFSLPDYPYYTDEKTEKPVVLGLAFLCRSYITPTLKQTSGTEAMYVLTKLTIDEINCENLEEIRKEELQKGSVSCWIIEKKEGKKKDKREKNTTEWLGSINIHSDKNPDQKVEISIASGVFEGTSLENIIIELKEVLTANLLSELDVNLDNHTESLSSLTDTLKNIDTVLFLLKKGHQKTLTPMRVYTPKKNITKITPHTHRLLLKYPHKQVIPFLEFQEKINPAYYGIISDLEDLLKYFNEQYLERVKYQHLKTSEIRIKYSGDPQLAKARSRFDSDTIQKGINKDIEKSKKELERIQNPIKDVINIIKKSEFYQQVLDNKPTSDSAPDVAFFQHDLNMQLFHYIEAFKKAIKFTDPEKEDNEYYFIKSKIDSVRITLISDLYEKWIGTQIVNILWENFHFTHESLSLDKFKVKLLLDNKDLKREVVLRNEKLGCEVELRYDLGLKKIEGGDATPDFYLKFTKNNKSKILIIDAKYTKYLKEKEHLKKAHFFGMSIADMAKKYYRAYDTSQDTSSPNIVFVAHPDIDVREALNYEEKPIGEVLYDVYLDIREDKKKDLLKAYEAKRTKLKERDEQIALDEEYKAAIDTIHTEYELNNSHHFGAIYLHPDHNFENDKQLSTLIRMVLQHHLGIKNWCFRCNKEAEKKNSYYDHTQYATLTSFECEKCKKANDSYFWIHYECGFCNTEFYSWLYSYVAHDSNDKIKCPQCRLGALKKPKESSN